MLHRKTIDVFDWYRVGVHVSPARLETRSYLLMISDSLSPALTRFKLMEVCIVDLRILDKYDSCEVTLT